MTDEDRLVRCLVANRSALCKFGTSVPSPSAYRKLFRDVFSEVKKHDSTTETRGTLLETIIGDDVSERIILSNSGFFGTPKMAAIGGVLYSEADNRISLLQDIFKNDEIELFMAICNPATFLPAVFEKSQFDNLTDYLRGAEPTTVRWSEMVKRIRGLFPNIPITIWCNEDTPLIWGQIIRELAGADPTMGIKGEFSLLSEIMSEIGMKRFKAYLASHPDMTEIQKRRVTAAFLDKFAEDSAIETEFDLPGWTEQLISQLTDIYDEDTYAIGRIPGVNMITP